MSYTGLNDRDPRKEPRRGDILRIGRRRFVVYYATSPGMNHPGRPRFVLCDRKTFTRRIETRLTLHAWRRLMAGPDAVIVRAADV